MKLKGLLKDLQKIYIISKGNLWKLKEELQCRFNFWEDFLSNNFIATFGSSGVYNARLIFKKAPMDFIMHRL